MSIILAKESRDKFFAEVVSKALDTEISNFYEANYLNRQKQNFIKQKYFMQVERAVFHKELPKEMLNDKSFDPRIGLRGGFKVFYSFVKAHLDGHDPKLEEHEFYKFLEFLGHTPNNHPFKLQDGPTIHKVSYKTNYFVNTKWEVAFTSFFSISNHFNVTEINGLSKAVLYCNTFGEAEFMHFNPEHNEELTFKGCYEISDDETELVVSLSLKENQKIKFRFGIEGKDEKIAFSVGSVKGVSINQLSQYCMMRKFNHKAKTTGIASYLANPKCDEYYSRFLPLLNLKSSIPIPISNINSPEELVSFLKIFIPVVGISVLATENSLANGLVQREINRRQSAFFFMPVPDHKKCFVPEPKSNFIKFENIFHLDKLNKVVPDNRIEKSFTKLRKERKNYNVSIKMVFEPKIPEPMEPGTIYIFIYENLVVKAQAKNGFKASQFVPSGRRKNSKGNSIIDILFSNSNFHTINLPNDKILNAANIKRYPIKYAD